ncbi:MAG: hypothetical protein K9J12_12735 [Melioribacteraceae bacterium]|nr:hypothetical protein [Melioribacteraceae bacterium]MCF8430488.1 hypothetical protein [Melioribacteraceae bacterium]
MTTSYLEHAMREAEYEVLDGIEAYFGQIPGFNGLYVYAKSISDCRRELADALIAWINMRMAFNLSIPKLRHYFSEAA